jgi:hypothetical protein
MQFLISYDLRQPGRNYQPLWDELARVGAFRVLLSAWYLNGNYTCSQLRDHFRQYIDANDALLVVEFAYNAAWTGQLIQNLPT